MDAAAAKAEFRSRGETIRGWADRHGFPPSSVYAVLAGRITGVRGQAHHIAVALGLKPGPGTAAPNSYDPPEKAEAPPMS